MKRSSCERCFASRVRGFVLVPCPSLRERSYPALSSLLVRVVIVMTRMKVKAVQGSKERIQMIQGSSFTELDLQAARVENRFLGDQRPAGKTRKSQNLKLTKLGTREAWLWNFGGLQLPRGFGAPNHKPKAPLRGPWVFAAEKFLHVMLLLSQRKVRRLQQRRKNNVNNTSIAQQCKRHKQTSIA